MDHAFEIGGNYRNRRGRYEVIELEGSRMVIRYSDGDTLEADVKTQWRIWQNIQQEGQAEEPKRRTRPTPAQPTFLTTESVYKANSTPSSHLGELEAEESMASRRLWSSSEIRWDGESSQLSSSDGISTRVGHQMRSYNQQQDGELSAYLDRLVSETLKSGSDHWVVGALAHIGYEVFGSGIPDPPVGLYSDSMQRLARGLLENPDLFAKCMSRTFQKRKTAHGVDNFIADALLGLYLRGCLLAGENKFISHIRSGKVILDSLEPFDLSLLRTIAQHVSWTMGQHIGIRTLRLLAPDQAEDEVWVPVKHLETRQVAANRSRQERPIPWDGVIELVNKSWREIQLHRRYGVPSQGRAEILTSSKVSNTIGLTSIRFIREGVRAPGVYVRFHFGETPRQIAIGRIVSGGKLEGFPELVSGSGLLLAVMRSIAVAYYRDLVTPDEKVYYTPTGVRRSPSSGPSSPRTRQLPRPRRIPTGPRQVTGSIHSFRYWVQERARHSVVGHARWVGSYFRADSEKKKEAREAGVQLEDGYTWVQEHERGGPGSAGAGGNSWDLSSRTVFSPPEDASNAIDSLFWR